LTRFISTSKNPAVNALNNLVCSGTVKNKNYERKSQFAKNKNQPM